MMQDNKKQKATNKSTPFLNTMNFKWSDAKTFSSIIDFNHEITLIGNAFCTVKHSSNIQCSSFRIAKNYLFINSGAHNHNKKAAISNIKVNNACWIVMEMCLCVFVLVIGTRHFPHIVKRKKLTLSGEQHFCYICNPHRC